MQQRLKSRSRAAWAQIVAPELLEKLDVAVHDPAAALDVGLGGIRVPALTRGGESRGGRRRRDACAWQPPSVWTGPRFYHGVPNLGKPQPCHHLVTNGWFLHR